MTLGRSFASIFLLSLAGCHAVDNLFCNGAGCEWTKEEWTHVQQLSNAGDSKGLGLPELPSDGEPSNQYLASGGDAIVNLGREFYFDPRFSGPATLSDSIGRPVPFARAAKGTAIGIACADCHNPARAGSDFTSQPNTVSIGAGWYDVNGEQTVNAVFFADIDGPFRGGRSRLYWNGRTETLWAQAAQVNESSFSMNGDRANTFWVILRDDRYLPDYNAIFGTDLKPAEYTGDRIPRHARPDKFNAALNDAFNCMTGPDKELVTRTQVNFGKAIEAYERTLLGGNSAFDRFVHDGASSDAISPAAKRGLHLFVGKASCIDCHNGYLLSDGDFHDIGVPQTGDHVPTVGDCPHGSARCDCTPGAETSSCAPAGAWAGWKKLVEDGVAKVNASRFATTSFTRNSEWSDVKTSESDYCVQADVSYKGAWRTPSLRDVAITAPYMHDGYYKTLEDVVWHYNNGGTVSGSDEFAPPEMTASDGGADTDGGADGGIQPCPQTGRPRGRAVQIKPLGLTDQEVSDLVEFLKTLTSTSVALPDAGFDAGASPDVPGTGACPSSMDGGTQ